MTKRLFFKSILLIAISWTTTTLCAKGEKSSAADSLPRLTARIDSFFERQRSAHMEKLWLHLDKPYYAAGDEMWFKAYLVDAVNHCSDTLSNFIYVDLIGRKGEIVFSKKVKRDRYGFTNNFIIPATFPTGDYTLRAYTGWMLNFDPAFFFQKNIPIGNPIADQIDAEISYTDLSAAKKQAVVRFRDENDRPYSDINIQFKIFDRNGKRLSSGQQRSSATGSIFAELPVISACEGGRIDLEIDNDRMYYKRTFFFPGSFSPFGIQFFPEGGDLIAGQPQRIAFKGESSDGSPISFSGTVFGSNGDTVARIVSEHDGMGVFTMSPQSGQDYRAEVTASDGRKLRTQLPTVKEDGYAIVVSQSPREIRYKIAAAPGSTCDSMILVTHVRGICTAIVSVDSGNLIGGWPTDSLPEGILHLILLDARGKPRSERLVFVSHPHQREVWSIAPDKPKYGRREQVHVRLALTDANAIPLEADCLRPLPAIRHQMKERRSATVMRNGYVTFRLHHYSVPKEYIGKRVEIVYDADTLEIYHGLRLVTTHQRDDTPYSYTTKDAHGLPGRHGSYEKDLEQIYERAGQTDNVLLLYLRKVAELKKYPPAAFRSCRGIMALEKTFGLERLVAASACATQLRLYGYQEIRRILERGDDADFLSKDDIDDEVPVTSIHKNIRGAAYFAQLKHLNRDNNGNK